MLLGIKIQIIDLHQGVAAARDCQIQMIDAFHRIPGKEGPSLSPEHSSRALLWLFLPLKLPMVSSHLIMAWQCWLQKKSAVENENSYNSCWKWPSITAPASTRQLQLCGKALKGEKFHFYLHFVSGTSSGLSQELEGI